MMGISVMETEGKEQVDVEAINKNYFAFVGSGIGSGLQNIKKYK